MSEDHKTVELPGVGSTHPTTPQQPQPHTNHSSVEEDDQLLPIPADVDSCLYDALFPIMLGVNVVFTVYYLSLCGAYTFALEGPSGNAIKAFAITFLVFELIVSVALPLWARDERPSWEPRKVVLGWFGLFAAESGLGWILALALPHAPSTTRNSVPAFAMTMLHISVLFLYLPAIYLNKFSTTYDECFRTGRRDPNRWIRGFFFIMSPMQLITKLFRCLCSTSASSEAQGDQRQKSRSPRTTH